ncbi:MAG: superoxide dismutase family protein [Eubacterium sp.]|nr:superoxide dismutase family protein [Eubacterium sp.]
MFQITPRLNFMKLFYDNRPRAYARIQGGGEYSQIQGSVYFYNVPGGGLLIEAEIFGLPETDRSSVPAFFAFHIHENGDCSNNFQNTGEHFNPHNQAHPRHEGDMPPLISRDGYAWMVFYDSGKELYDIVGKSVLIHRNADDFTSQPSGNAGEKIACGVIQFIDDFQKA